MYVLCSARGFMHSSNADGCTGLSWAVAVLRRLATCSSESGSPRVHHPCLVAAGDSGGGDSGGIWMNETKRFRFAPFPASPNVYVPGQASRVADAVRIRIRKIENTENAYSTRHMQGTHATCGAIYSMLTLASVGLLRLLPIMPGQRGTGQGWVNVYRYGVHISIIVSSKMHVSGANRERRLYPKRCSPGPILA